MRKSKSSKPSKIPTLKIATTDEPAIPTQEEPTLLMGERKSRRPSTGNSLAGWSEIIQREGERHRQEENAYIAAATLETVEVHVRRSLVGIVTQIHREFRGKFSIEEITKTMAKVAADCQDLTATVEAELEKYRK